MVKVIPLSNKAYETLKGLKKGKDSFSDVVMHLVNKEKKVSLLEFAGIWKDAPEMDKIFEDVLHERHNSRDRKINLKW